MQQTEGGRRAARQRGRLQRFARHAEFLVVQALQADLLTQEFHQALLLKMLQEGVLKKVLVHMQVQVRTHVFP